LAAEAGPQIADLPNLPVGDGIGAVLGSDERLGQMLNLGWGLIGSLAGLGQASAATAVTECHAQHPGVLSRGLTVAEGLAEARSPAQETCLAVADQVGRSKGGTRAPDPNHGGQEQEQDAPQDEHCPGHALPPAGWPRREGWQGEPGQILSARPLEGGSAGGGLELEPADAVKIDLDPGVAILLGDHPAVSLLVIRTLDIAAGQTGWHADGTNHDDHGRGEVVAIALLQVKEKVVDKVAVGGRIGEVEAVGVAPQVALDGPRTVVAGRRVAGDLTGRVAVTGEWLRSSAMVGSGGRETTV
jgi:hypothetical protein